MKFRHHLMSIAVVGLLLAMAVQMLLAAAIDGATTDEQIHIISGYATITDAHILFDPEHPFLAKSIAAIPLLFVHLTIPAEADHLDPSKADPNYNTYAEANLWGYQTLFELGNNPEVILWLTRAMIALLTVLLGYIVYRWTKSLFGTASAVAALTLIAFDPSFLGHGHLANDDTVAALFFVAALAAYYQYLKKPTIRSMAIAGLVLGLGLITKFSLLLLGPIFAALLVAWLIFHRRQELPVPNFAIRIKQSWLRYVIGLAGIFGVCWLVIWVSYGSLMVINPTYNPQSFSHPDWPAWFTQIVGYLIPVMWGKGVLYLFGPQAHARDGYLLGECYLGGKWDYFAIVSAVKIPLITLGLFATTLILWWKKRRSVGFDPLILLIPIGVYFIISCLSSINIGFRHLLPAYALLIIAAAYPFSLINWKKVPNQLRSLVLNPTTEKFSITESKSEIWMSLPAIVLILSLIGTIIVGLYTYPNYLSYYNILSGEPQSIPYISSDSNVDWGQGTKQLKQYLVDNQIDSIAFDNFTGTGEAKHYGLPLVEISPSDHHYTGYLALSRSTIIDHKCTKNNDWGWVIDHYQPVAIIGNSINLYKIE